MLNGVTRRGPFLGNSAGVLAMMYNGEAFISHCPNKSNAASGINSYIGYLRGRRKISCIIH